MHHKSCKTAGSCFTDTVKKCLRRCACDTGAFPLSSKKSPGKIRICSVSGDRKVCGRIAALGVYPGVEADIICSGKNQRCILKVNGGTLSLDADISANILVSSL